MKSNFVKKSAVALKGNEECRRIFELFCSKLEYLFNENQFKASDEDDAGTSAVNKF